MEKTLIVMIGLPGSGKSTWVRNYLKNSEVEFQIVSSDDIIMKYAEKEGLNYTEGFPKFSGIAAKEMKRNARKYAAEGLNVIWDQTNMSVKSRKLAMSLFKDYKKIAVVFSICPKELERRLEKREKEEGKHIPDFVIDTMSRKYNEPTKEEGFDKIVFIT